MAQPSQGGPAEESARTPTDRAAAKAAEQAAPPARSSAGIDGGGMSAPEKSATMARPRPGDWAIAAATLGIFVTAFVLAGDYPGNAALFPRMVSAAGAFLALLKLVQFSVQTVRARREPATAATGATAATAATASPAAGSAAAGSSDVEIVDDEAEDDDSMEYVFASAGGRAWASALAWIVLFFVSFVVLGAFLTVPLFALVYLKVSGRASWLAATAYALVTGLIIYLTFRQLVFIPLPNGVFDFPPI